MRPYSPSTVIPNQIVRCTSQLHGLCEISGKHWLVGAASACCIPLQWEVLLVNISGLSL